MLAGRLLGRLMRWFGQPTVIAEILAGILLGPSLLGVVSPGALDALFPAASLSVLGTTAQLGLVFFMFLVGLEFDPGLLRGQGRASVAISNAGIIVPFLLGLLTSIPLYDTLAPEGVSKVAFGLFLGAAMSVTAFPVLARILAEKRLIRTRVGALALASAAVDDVTAWCLLAFVVAVAGASGVGPALLTTALALVYVLVMWKVVRPMLARIGPRVGHAVSSDTIAFVFLVLLASAAVTEWIGIHALFGAFLLGAILPRERGLHTVLVEKIEDFVTIVLLPLFFAYSGLRTQIGLLDDPSAWLTTLAIIAVACFGKFGGTAIAARLSGLDLRSAAAIGVLMNTRGLMELVVLNIGLDLGVISTELFAMMVIMALVTTWLTSPLLERIFPAAKMAEEAAHAPRETPTRAEPAPAALVCVSDPGIAPALVHLADAWTRASKGSVWALYLSPTARLSESMHGPNRDEDPLHAVAATAARVGLAVDSLSFPSATPGEDIVRMARLKRVPLVLIGVHRSALLGETLGGATGAILRGSPVDVGVLVDRGLVEVRRVGLVAGTGPHAAAAERFVARLTAEGQITVLRLSPGAVPTGVDLVVAPFAERGAIPDPSGANPDGEGPSWLLVHAPSGKDAA
ncbi:MAG: cation:proton antiporter [Pseudomonadota bacterium]|nr:cation:proton antiporter [Pseudomonadota bacterium]